MFSGSAGVGLREEGGGGVPIGTSLVTQAERKAQRAATPYDIWWRKAAGSTPLAVPEVQHSTGLTSLVVPALLTFFDLRGGNILCVLE